MGRGAIAALRQKCFDVVVVCHSVRCTEVEQIHEAAHAHYAKALVVRVMPFWVGDSSNYKSSFDAVASSDPVLLVGVVQELLRQRARTAA